MDYGYRKETRGYSVWTLAAATGDVRDWLKDVPSEKAAQREVNRLYGRRAEFLASGAYRPSIYAD